MLKFFTTTLIALCSFVILAAEPFEWSGEVETGETVLTLTVAPDAYVYKEETTVGALLDGKKVAPLSEPVAVEKFDSALERDLMVYPSGTHSWEFEGTPQISVDYQGCSGSICYPPDTFFFGGAKAIDAVKIETGAIGVPEFKVIRTKSGLTDAADMVKFLNEDGNSDAAMSTGIWGILLATLFGGLLLNLTPCVLPLIPVNLAIIGAGKSENRLGGLISGGVYGLGMAAAYGVLGLLAAFAGTKFGTLNTSASFNFSVGVIFAFLALAMFGIFNLDFTRFSGGFSIWRKGRLVGVFFFGALAALLAGACVAPVVVSVLLLAAAGGVATGLPFLLGIGMALPWPLAGAGIAVLPKPGAWMQYVKWVFGGIIAVLAVYYVSIGFSLLPGKSDGGYSMAAELTKLDIALNESEKTGKPVFVDVWSTTCKNCIYMEKTTFVDPKVKESLNNFIVVKFQIEDYSNPAAKELLERFSTPGLPVVAIIER